MAGWKSPRRVAIFNSRPDFVHLHKPELVIYDVPRPYERHWNFLRLLKETDSLEAAVGASG